MTTCTVMWQSQIDPTRKARVHTRGLDEQAADLLVAELTECGNTAWRTADTDEASLAVAKNGGLL